jgi:proteasome accessory factor A
VATHKYCGIETEYGIVLRGVAESNPIAASSLLINAYLGELEGADRVGWDFEDENPANDARGASPAGTLAPEVETHLVNAVLTNGARYYVDHAHPELSTPECADARSVVVWDRAAETILVRSMEAARRVLPPGQEIVIYKNNSDGKGNSYGCHENYLMDRSVPFHRIVTHATAHFVSRQVYCGAGKVGTELAGASSRDIPYQLTQRADFFEAEVGLETTLKRPIVNTRDEPHADAQKYRRLHVICGDANLSETATFLKVGTTAIVLAMVEDDATPDDMTFRSPVQAIRRVSHDLGLRHPLELVDGSTITALDLQWAYLDAAQRYAASHGLAAVGEETGKEVLVAWESVLAALEADPERAADRVDWVAKKRLLEAYQDRHGVGWDDPRVAGLALQYHDLRPERSLAARVGLARIAQPDEIERATTFPPPDTRAWFRGTCLKKWAPAIIAANWDSMVFDVGLDPLRRVPMMEPGRGTEAQVGDLVAACDTPAELIERLGA